MRRFPRGSDGWAETEMGAWRRNAEKHPCKGSGDRASQGCGGQLRWAGRRVRNEAEGSVVSGVHSGLNCVP